MLFIRIVFIDFNYNNKVLWITFEFIVKQNEIYNNRSDSWQSQSWNRNHIKRRKDYWAVNGKNACGYYVQSAPFLIYRNPIFLDHFHLWANNTAFQLIALAPIARLISSMELIDVAGKCSVYLVTLWLLVAQNWKIITDTFAQIYTWARTVISTQLGHSRNGQTCKQ